MLLPKIETLYIFNHKKNSYILPHSHKCYELVYIYEGCIKTNLQGETHTLGESQLILYPPGISHDEFHDEETRCLCLTFSMPDNSLPFIIHKDTLQFTALFDMLVTEFLKNSANREDIINTIINLIILKISSSSKQKDTETIFLDIVQYIDLHFQEDMDLKQLSVNFGYSYDYLRHKFKDITGASLQNYIIRKRINYSKNMLKDSSLPISLIATNCGFNSIAYFSAMFRRYTKLTPLQYRKSKNT